MKKATLSIITFLYIMLSIGFSMDIHYCMGKREGVDFFKVVDGKCGKCGMPEDETGCCSNHHSFYKIVDSHKHISPLFFSILSFDVINPKAYSIVTFSPLIYRAKGSIKDIPDICSPPIFIRNCVFRI